ncbi:MAG TPA: PAS domain S-box protein [Chthoniobacteraceae bacterium]|jgi:two-component system sensor histidine kinase UhpB
MKAEAARSALGLTLRVVVPYAALAVLWILASDSGLMLGTNDPELLVRWSTFKGIAFVLVTALALFFLLHRVLSSTIAAHRATELSEARLRLALEAACIGSWELDLATGEAQHSRIHDRIFGYEEPAPSWTYATFREHVHPDERERADELFRIAGETGELAYAEFRIIRKDGAMRRIWVRGGRLENIPGRETRLLGMVGDLTERAAAEEDLRLHHEALEHSLNAFHIVDASGRIIYVNHAFLLMWGYERAEEVLGRSVSEFCIDPELPAAVLNALREKGECRQEFTGRRKDGTTFEVQMASRSFQSHDGRQLIFSSSLDLTARQEAKAAVEELATRLSTTLESITEAFFTVDRGWRVTYFNQAAEKLLQRTRESLLGKTLWEEFPGPLDSVFDRQYQRAVETGNPVRFEAIYVPLDVWVEVNAYPSEQGLAIYFRDVTQRRQAEEALRESEERFRAVFEQAPVGICQISVEGKFERVNPRLCEMLGYAEEELLALGFVDVTYPEDVAMSRELTEEVLTGRRKVVSLEKRYVQKSNSVIWADSTVTLMPGTENRSPALIAIVRDITADKHAEEERQRMNEELRALTARMESLREEERTRISREIHDELGQLLTALKMDLRWLERRVEAESAETPHPFLERIVGATEMADATLRAVQRIAADLRPGVLDKLGLATALRYEARRFQERTGIACAVQHSSELPAIGADRTTALFRIFQECLTNVARHSGATEVRVSLDLRGGMLTLSVEDNGCGMKEDAAEGRASLGVLGMKERAAKMGGELSFHPGKSGGTIVAVRLPESDPPT